jgi:arsenate reductase
VALEYLTAQLPPGGNAVISYRVTRLSITMTTTLYGIPNCDTVKKARVWLADQQQDFVFHDFKKQGLTREIVAGWLKHLSRDVLVNRKGTTWRALSDERKASIVDDEAAIALMLENPSVIKRPVLDKDGVFAVSFSAAQYTQIFNL